jgi:hypothetical protein
VDIGQGEQKTYRVGIPMRNASKGSSCAGSERVSTSVGLAGAYILARTSSERVSSTLRSSQYVGC